MLFLHPEMGDDGSGPVIILILILTAVALVGGVIYLMVKLIARLSGRR